MKELNYQYKIIEEKSINGKNILKVKDDIYDKIVFMEIYKTTDSNDWDKSSEVEREINKLKDNGEISDYFINDDYSSGIKTFYKIYEDYKEFENHETNTTNETTESKIENEIYEEVKENINDISFDDNLSDPTFKSDDNYELGDLSDSIGDGYQKGAQEFLNFMFSDDNVSGDIKKIIDISENMMGTPTTTKEEFVQTTITSDGVTIDKSVVHKSEVKLNSYASKTNKEELERIKNLSKRTSSQKTNYNSYSNYRVSNNTKKKSGKAGVIFILLIIFGVSAFIWLNKAKRAERARYNMYKSMNKYKNYKLATDYYKNNSYYSAEIYFKRACNYDKDKRGCSMLGYIYETGKVYRKNKYRNAVEYYVKGCELNDAYSCERAGVLSRINLKENQYALKYDLRGCDLNSGVACTETGYVYEVIKKDTKTAKKFYEKACKLKNAVGCYNLALIYHYDKIKGIKDINKAKKLYKKACQLDYKQACDVKFEDNVLNNNKKDIEISDNPKEIYDLALSYQNKKDYFNANLLFQKACSKGDGKSCSFIGYNYEKGYGYAQSNMMAKDYYLKACEKDNGYGCNKIAYFYEVGIEFKKNLKQARKFYKKSCNLKYGLGCSNLALIFKEGKGIRKDEASAKFLYKKACKLGYKKACKKY